MHAKVGTSHLLGLGSLLGLSEAKVMEDTELFGSTKSPSP